MNNINKAINIYKKMEDNRINDNKDYAKKVLDLERLLNNKRVMNITIEFLNNDGVKLDEEYLKIPIRSLYGKFGSLTYNNYDKSNHVYKNKNVYNRNEIIK